MNRFFILALLVITVLSSCRGKVVMISGILEHPVAGKYIFLDELKSDKVITVDAVMLSGDGSFEMKIKIKNPSFYQLKINQNNFLTMLVEPGEKIKMTSHFDSLNYPVVVSGSKGTGLIADYNKKLLSTRNKIRGLNDLFNNNTGRSDMTAFIDSLDRLGDAYLNEINSYAKEFIDKNISSLATIPVLYSMLTPSLYVFDPQQDLQYFLKVDSSLFSLYPEYGPVIDLHNQINEMRAYFATSGTQAAAGGEYTEAPEIALPDPGGDTIRLSSTRGNYVLLDFWAAWCPPCRAENPNLVAVFNKYKSKGFLIYQVSLDKTRDAWLKGIKDDGLGGWIHVSDLGYWNSSVVPLYRLESIPANFLLDREGRIIASNLRGDALQRKLEELFN